MLIPSSPCPAATEVRFSSPPPAANANWSAPPLSRSTHAAVISYQPSPGLPASQVTMSISDLLALCATDLGHFGAQRGGRPLRAQRGGDHCGHRRHLAAT